jgi:hypothetical protein
MTTAPARAFAEGALIAILENVPSRWYKGKREQGHTSAQLKGIRRCVHIMLAKHAQRDGTNMWASVARIAHYAKVSVSVASEAIQFFVETGRLKPRGESEYETVIYDLVLPTPEEAKEAQREREAALEDSRASARLRKARSRAAAKAKGGTVTPARSVTQTPDVTPPGSVTGGDVTPPQLVCHTAARVTVTPPHGDNLSGLSVRVSEKRESVEQQAGARNEAGALSLPSNDLNSIPKAKSPDRIEALARKIEAAIRAGGVPLTKKLRELVRRRLSEGMHDFLIIEAVRNTMRNKPPSDLKPHFYLEQNLDAEIELAFQEWDAKGNAAWEASQGGEESDDLLEDLLEEELNSGSG